MAGRSPGNKVGQKKIVTEAIKQKRQIAQRLAAEKRARKKAENKELTLEEEAKNFNIPAIVVKESTGGKPSKCTDRMVETIAGMVSKGLDASVAARAVGMSEASVSLWWKRGEAEYKKRLEELQSRGIILEECETEEEVRETLLSGDLGDKKEARYLKYYISVNRAQALFEAKMLSNIQEYAEKSCDWRGPMELLARKHPERWAKVERNQAELKITQNYQLDQSTREALAAAMVGVYQTQLNDVVDGTAYSLQSLESGEDEV
jgi:DNA-binding Lrp family transcriptional regulator